VGGIDGQYVGPGADQLRCALQEVAGGSDSSANAQTALGIFAGVGVFELFLDVLDGDEALELVLVVDDQQLFDAVLVQDQFGFFKRGADRDGDQVGLGHHVADGDVGAGLEAQIAVGEDADQALAAGDGYAGDLVAAHDFECRLDGLIGLDGDGIDDHAAFGALDLVDFAGLVGDRQIAVHDADSTLLGHGDGHARLGDRVHGGRDQRGIQGNVLGELGLRAHLGRAPRPSEQARAAHRQRSKLRVTDGQHKVLMLLGAPRLQGEPFASGRQELLVIVAEWSSVYLEKNASGRAAMILQVEAGSVESEAVPERFAKGELDLNQLSWLTHEDCATFSRDFGTLLDVEELGPDGEYVLEASSPGLDRKLNALEDFERFKGSLVKIQTFEPIANNRHWHGRLTLVGQDGLTLDLTATKQNSKARKTGASTVEIGLSNIEKAQLVPEF
jgi:ribosome maturation factor RimP